MYAFDELSMAIELAKSSPFPPKKVEYIKLPVEELIFVTNPSILPEIAVLKAPGVMSKFKEFVSPVI